MSTFFDKHRKWIAKISRGLLLGWLIFACAITVWASEDGESSNILVSLGDSYSSGEGLPEYYHTPNVEKYSTQDLDWLAHRSPKAWSGKLHLSGLEKPMSNYKDKNWFFMASSGATTKDILGQQKKTILQQIFMEEDVELPMQAAVFQQENGPKKGSVDYITLTIGGNDADFVGIVEAAMKSIFSPTSLTDKINKTWVDFLKENGIKENLYDTYRAITDLAGKQAHLMVVGYPPLFNQNGFLWVDADDANLINKNVHLFNEAIKEIVHFCQEDGMNISFVSVEKDFKTHEAYTSLPYIHKISFGAGQEPLNKYEWRDSKSVHPNELGAGVYAKCVQEKIDELEAAKYDVLNKDAILAIYNRNNRLSDRGIVKIKGKRERYISLNNYRIPSPLKTRYEKTFLIEQGKKVQLHLPEGSYTVTIQDPLDKTLVYQKNIIVGGNEKRKLLLFHTAMLPSETDASSKRNILDEQGAESKKNLVKIVKSEPLDSREAHEDNKEKRNLKGESGENERDIVLTLDNSGSMAGTPIRETVRAAHKFMEMVLEKNANVGIVTYSESANEISNFRQSREIVQTELSTDTGGGTNIEAGLLAAWKMLQEQESKKKIIVLMSDGEPNQGKEGEELIALADEIKKAGITIYTIGFFDEVDNPAECQLLMEKIASEGYHYEVKNADELVLFFGDIGEQINGTKYTYIRIACPVDVMVSYQGETLNSAQNQLNMRTSFGSLTFEEGDGQSDKEIDDRVKILRLKEGADYDISIAGNGKGKMNYTIGFMDENGDYSDIRKFRNIPINAMTQIDTVASSKGASILNIDEDGDGKYDERLRADTNSNGRKVASLTEIIALGSALCCLLMFELAVVVLYCKIRKR